MTTRFRDSRHQVNNGEPFERRGRRWRWAIVASLVLVGAAASADAQTVFDNFNAFAVGDGPTAATTFTISTPTNVTQLITYHWNFGRGAAPGTIKLQGSSGRFYGPYGTAGVVGSNNVQNAAWVATIGGLILPADTYTVVDSDPMTWAENAQSGGRGFARVYGSAAANMCPAAYPNCTCRGTGCTHPDLRPWGGDGPNGVGPDVDIPYNSSAYFWVTPLPPSASTVPALLAQRCASLRGTFIVLLDDAWRYFYSGFYATVGCRR